MKYYLIAGERSGDLHASNLMKGLLLKDPAAEFRYFGGDYMQKVSGEPVVHYKEMAFMGFWEVIKNLGAIKKYLKLCKEDIISYKPDALILVDYAGFNLRIAKFAKENDFKVFYYISPKIWAWNQKRAFKIKNSVDHMFAILPFEVEFYKRFDFDEVTYVGNPVVEAVEQHIPNPSFLRENNLDEINKPLIAVLPGSRIQELKYVLPVLEETIKANQEYHFAIAGIANLPASLYTNLLQQENATILYDQTYDLLANARAAIVTSGTATLETALWNVPQVVVYRGNWLSISIGRMVIKVKYISLVNLIIDKPLITELIQGDCTSERITNELEALVESPTDYAKLNEILGSNVASEETAAKIFTLIQANK